MISSDIFPWNDNYNTGLPEIDRQHRRLVEMLNEIARHVVSGIAYDHIQEMLVELTAYTDYHFSQEEKTWGDCLFPDDEIVQHKKTHDGFINKLQDLKADSGKPVQELTAETMRLLVGWLSRHILEHDWYMARMYLAVKSGKDFETAKQLANLELRERVAHLFGILLPLYEGFAGSTIGMMLETAERKNIEQRYLEIFQSSTIGISIIRESDLSYLELNRAFMELTGYAYDELVGHSGKEIGLWPYAEERQRLLDDLQSRRGGRGRELRIRTKSGNEVWCEVSFSSMQLEGESCVVCFTRDISDLKLSQLKLAEEKDKYESLMLTSGDGIHVIGMDGSVVDVNNKFCEMLGYTREEALGLKVADWDAKYSREELITRLSEKFEVPTIFETLHRRRNGEIIEVEVSARMIPYAGREVLWCASRDITQRKIVERTLQFISQNSWTGEQGSFIEALLKYLHGILNIQYAYVGVLVPGHEVVESIAFLAHEQIVHNFVHKLKGSPGEVIAKNGMCLCQEGVRDRFPQDQYLEELCIEGYCGIALRDNSGNPIGLLAVLDPDKLNNVQLIETQLQLVSPRVSAEIEQKLADLKETKLKRAIMLLSECNALLVRQDSEQELLQQICRLIVETGGYSMAWIGYAEHDRTKSVHVEAQYGFDDGYLDSIRITWADEPHGHGPTGTAIRTGRPSTFQNIHFDPLAAPWRSQAMKRNFNSSAAVPLLLGGKVIGALSVYSLEPFDFSVEEVRLLEELAANLTYGIQMLREQIIKTSAIYSLNRQNEKNRVLLRNTGDGIFIVDTNGYLIEFSESFSRLLGYQPEEMDGLHILHWDMRFTVSDSGQAILDDFFRDNNRRLFETIYLHKDGSGIDVEVSCVPLELDGSRVLFGQARDIRERRQAENDLRIAATAFESKEGMMITDANNAILKVNHAFTEITGYTATEVIGKNPGIFSSGMHHDVFYQEMWQSINTTGTWEGEIWDQRKNGEMFPQHLIITAVKDYKGDLINYVASFTDISDRKKSEEEIQHLAFYDQVTQLPNRRLMLDRLHQAMVSSERNGKHGAVLLIDMDNFKIFNDSLGHAMGDLLLSRVADRLSSIELEYEVNTIARLGGDEFVVLLEDLAEDKVAASERADAAGETILDVLSQPYRLDMHLYTTSCSIGITLFSGQQNETSDLLKQADIAMYQAKRAGRNTLRFFDSTMQDTIDSRVALEIEMHRALEADQFQLHYQLQVNDRNEVIGAEALIRWVNPQYGTISPAKFIPVAEENGLILKIGQWVLEKACAQLKEWEQVENARNLTLAVNVSARQFHHEDFVSRVRDAIDRHAIRAELLKLELTESLLVENVEVAIRIMTALKDIGVRISLDDFGTGYSSLQYLKRLPLDQLKIDQSFVRDIAIDNNDLAIVNTIIAMARTLDLDVIAEGVETEDHLRLLQQGGCSSFQGYLFGKPIPIDEFGRLIGQAASVN